MDPEQNKKKQTDQIGNAPKVKKAIAKKKQKKIRSDMAFETCFSRLENAFSSDEDGDEFGAWCDGCGKWSAIDLYTTAGGIYLCDTCRW